MTTFDSWEAAVHPPEDYLMHFRTRGSKNGVRRYQTESGEWTELGLEERRKREGWGDGASRAERKAQKRVEKAEKAAAKAEKRQARKEIRAQKKFERSEARRKRTLAGLTDEEMKAKLERAKMEAEYRDLTKRGSLIEAGSKLIGKYLEYKNNKEQRAIEMNRQKIEMERLRTQQIQAKESTKQAKEASSQTKSRIQISENEAKKAGAEAAKEKFATKGGKKYERKAQLVNAKKEYKVEKRSALGTWLKNKANKEKNQVKNDQEYRMQLAKNEFGVNTARANAEKSKYEADASRSKAEEAKYASQTAAANAKQAEYEQKWKEVEAAAKAKQKKK